MNQPELQMGETDATRKILQHLDELGIAYEKLEHEPVTTSEAAAGARASRIEQGAKALIVKSDETYYHLVISAGRRLDNKKLRGILGTRRVRFAMPKEVMELTGCLPGAVPPFGNLFGLLVLMDDALMAEEEVYFNCGSHTISLRMRRDDLVRATDAETHDFHRE